MTRTGTHARAALSALATLAVLPMWACGDVPQRKAEVSLPAVGACAPRVARSRWSPSGASYTQTAAWGRGTVNDEWVESLGGIARSPDGDIYVYDPSQANVVVLTGDLKLRRRFGRAGEGPGELQTSFILLEYMPHWLDLLDSTVIVFDGWAVNRFSLDGRFLRRTSPPAVLGIGGFPFPSQWTAGIRLDDERLLWTEDLRHARGKPEYITSWSIGDSADARALLRMELIPRPGGGVTGTDQTHPIWAVRGGCIVHGDGSSFLVRTLDRPTGHIDSVPLPPYNPPEVPASAREISPGVRAMVRAQTGRDPGATHAEPSAVARWQQAVLDPDGFLWIQAWDLKISAGGLTPADRPQVVFIVDLASAEAVRDTVPAFPFVFGEPGTYYSVVRDPESDVRLVKRYELSGESRP